MNLKAKGRSSAEEQQRSQGYREGDYPRGTGRKGSRKNCFVHRTNSPEKKPRSEHSKKARPLQKNWKGGGKLRERGMIRCFSLGTPKVVSKGATLERVKGKKKEFLQKGKTRLLK